MQCIAERPLVFEDKTIVCQGCGEPFLFSGSEQDFFASKGLMNEPKKCHDCRDVQKLVRKGLSAEIMTKVECAKCGKATRVPFKPKGYRPVYCVFCMHERGKEAEPGKQVTAIPGASDNCSQVISVCEQSLVGQ